MSASYSNTKGVTLSAIKFIDRRALYLLSKNKNQINLFKKMSADNIKEAENDEQEEILDEELTEKIDESEVEEVPAEEKRDEKEVLIEKLEKELSEAKDSVLRKAAELENVRKRVQRERVALFEDAKIAALEDFLPITEDMALKLLMRQVYPLM